jgi:hypothetical protein
MKGSIFPPFAGMICLCNELYQSLNIPLKLLPVPENALRPAGGLFISSICILTAKLKFFKLFIAYAGPFTESSFAL